jgi:hypothetical protein
VGCCPAHDDSKPSLSVDVTSDGRVLVVCRSHGCSFAQIVAASGLTVHDMFPPRPGGAAPRERFTTTDALRLIDREVQRAAILIAVCANRPEQLTAERRRRLMESASLIRRARQACGIREAGNG